MTPDIGSDLFGPAPLTPREQEAAALLWDLWETGAVLWIREDDAGQMADAEHVTADQRARLKALAPEIRTCIRRLEAETELRRREAAEGSDAIVGLSGEL